MNKKEKYILKKQKKEKERFRRARNRKLKKVLFVSLPALFIVGSIAFLVVNYSPEESHPGISRIEINSQEYDAGTVSMAKGLIKYTSKIKNTGEGDLKIDRIWTSCHCTTAILKVGDKTSPEFGMNSSGAFWSQKIAPGQTGQLEVIFDPAFHGPQGIGSAVRIVYLSTNDPENKKEEIKLLANVVP